ncbi:nucleoside hydrolase [Halobacillus naozhouensis]|uniref:Nucleoside hydrolase n=1 Tax=Halobacillus naozhouensis TaxID=554880 RepID=A0ABY8IUM2_9BACI|nr:nucleoside hydrolase [Halobacillus naozhouensis]WFT73002.1 nucleoside hydrolase [Halobacillus naozhouensis]
MAQKVLLFGDIGIDDAIAIIYSFFNKDIDIVGIVADYGNVSRETAVNNVYYLYDLLGIEDGPPIIGGAEVPMTAEYPIYAPEVHGESGLGPIIPDDYGGESENFFEIVKLIEKYQDDLIIVNIGRLTSLATMFILYRSLMEKVDGFYIMGGAFWVPGNVTAVSEANFYSDPVAVQIVLRYAHNTTIIPLNVTRQAIVTPEMVEYIDYKGKTKIIKPMLDYYYDFYKEKNPDIQGSPVHDVLTVMASIRDNMFTYQTFPIHIVEATEHVQRGQSIAKFMASEMSEYEETDKPHRIAFGFDYSIFFNDFMSIMTGEPFNSRT